MFASTTKAAANGHKRLRKDAHETESDLTGVARAIGEQVRDAVENALDSAGDGISVAKDTLYDATGTVAKRIRKKPVESALIAAGVGLLIGALLGVKPQLIPAGKRMAFFSLDKLLGLAGMGTMVADLALLKRFLSGVAIVLALTAISSTMAGVLIIAAFYGIYVGLAHYGLEPRMAAVVVSSIAVIATIALAVMANMRWRQLREIPSFLPATSPLGRAGKLADAFVSGLVERSRQR